MFSNQYTILQRHASQPDVRIAYRFLRLCIVQLAHADRSHNQWGFSSLATMYCILTNRSLLFHYIIAEVLSVLYFWNALKSVKWAYIYLLPSTSQLRTVTSEGFGILTVNSEGFGILTVVKSLGF